MGRGRIFTYMNGWFFMGFNVGKYTSSSHGRDRAIFNNHKVHNLKWVMILRYKSLPILLQIYMASQKQVPYIWVLQISETSMISGGFADVCIVFMNGMLPHSCSAAMQPFVSFSFGLYWFGWQWHKHTNL